MHFAKLRASRGITFPLGRTGEGHAPLAHDGRRGVWGEMLRRLALIALFSVFATSILEARPTRPNILLIMADDLGFSDLACYGGEIATPNLDRLASEGLRYTAFYNTGRCWPTRGALLTGYYAQQIRRDSIPGLISGNQGHRPEWAPLLARLLREAGYRSYHTGKWHIDGMPLAEGFDRSYYLKDQGRFFSPQQHWKDDEKLPPVERGTGFYGTIALADHVIEVLDEHQRDHAEAPFFHYLAFAAPHFPLHALPGDVDLYRGTYDPGWERIRERRWHRMREMGLLDGELSRFERDLGPPYHFPDHLAILGDAEVNLPVPWEELTPRQQQFQQVKMELHAAMVHRMDLEIGRVFERIRDMGAWEDTLIMFLSDNGASAEIMVRGDGHDPEAEPGSADSYLCLGPGWSTASNAPFRRHKTWTHEGGIATPLIVSWPRGIPTAGEIRHTPGHVIDIVPTLLDVIGMRPPVTDGPAMSGISLVPTFESDAELNRDYLWWFHDGHRAIRKGDWKAVAEKGGSWELYDLAEDRDESTDLAGAEPERVEALAALWEEVLAEFRTQAASGLDESRREAHRRAEERRAGMRAAQRAAEQLR